MAIEHIDHGAGPERAAEILARDGCVVVDGLAPAEELERVREEIAPFLEATPRGVDAFAGTRTRRTGGLIARCPTVRRWIECPLVVESARRVLRDSTRIRLHLTQVIAIGPGESAQPVHRDQWAFDFFPFPKGYEVQCNTIWALGDFEERNGATRVVPGSHRFEDRREIPLSETEAAEMGAGSALLYTGALYHGGGANESESDRIGINLTYARSWLRQEENQYLSCPPEIARELPESLQRLMGYDRGAYALGYVEGGRDPIEVLRPERGQEGFGDLRRAADQARSPLVPGDEQEEGGRSRDGAV